MTSIPIDRVERLLAAMEAVDASLTRDVLELWRRLGRQPTASEIGPGMRRRHAAMRLIVEAENTHDATGDCGHCGVVPLGDCGACPFVPPVSFLMVDRSAGDADEYRTTTRGGRLCPRRELEGHLYEFWQIVGEN